MIKPILITYLVTRERKYRNKMHVYFCNIFQAFSFKMTLQKSNSHKESLHSMSLQLLETCKNERVTVLRHFYTVSFKLSVKNKTGKSQRVRDKTYKVVNLFSMCASIISMDISTAWPTSHIHTWIYPWIYPWISISTASLKISKFSLQVLFTQTNSPTTKVPCLVQESGIYFP